MVDIVRVDGLKELQATLTALGKEYGDRSALNPVRNALMRLARVVQKSAKDKVRRRSGTLADNIIVTSKGRADPNGLLSAKVTVRAKAKAYKDNARNRKSGKVGGKYKNYGPLFYARFLEFGTSKMRPYPFLRPAFEENKAKLPLMFKVELAAAIERSVKKLRP